MAPRYILSIGISRGFSRGGQPEMRRPTRKIGAVCTIKKGNFRSVIVSRPRLLPTINTGKVKIVKFKGERSVLENVCSK